MPNIIRNDLVQTNKLRIVQGFYDALAQGNVRGVLALLHPEVKWTEAERFPYYTGSWIGPQAVFDNLLKRLATDWSGFSATPKSFLIEDSTVVAFGTYAGTYIKTGKSMTSDFAHVWTVADDRITSFLMYTDTAKVLEALVT